MLFQQIQRDISSSTAILERRQTFIHRKRAKFVPSKYSAVCSEHFLAEDFERKFSSLPGFSKKMQAALKRDEFGIVAFPTISQTPTEDTTAGPSGRKTNRAHRQVSMTSEVYVNQWLENIFDLVLLSISKYFCFRLYETPFLSHCQLHQLANALMK